MTTKCFELNLKLQTAWHTAKIFADDARKVRINEKLKYLDVRPYTKKAHKICMN